MQIPGFLSQVLAPFHLLAFSTLLGTQLYQTFIVTRVCYRALPRSAFTTLQKRIFPFYFRIQTLMILLTALSYLACGPVSVIKKKTDWVAFLVALLTAGLNTLVFEPRTRQIMISRIHQGKCLSHFRYGSLADRYRNCRRKDKAADR
jgi:hypothetical protein